ncbi:MAG: LptF/LptG family permease [candidate division WOR-3 bacterium]|jgi:lipopolysaccharide export system permease protein|nr:LptF/LptG family permease [candidate division WOR-3 bacterium]MCR4423329.1 LptF/LptG family permease [candidate division WOR-3 bacterium]MDH7518668.1 LptF/LptG family permease [bacterium]
MKIIYRHLLYELIKFTLLALLSVVTIYLLIDLFEELSYFTSRKVGLLVILRYYFYSLPTAVALLYPVSLILAVFVVYGQMTRNNEIAAFQSAGVVIYRLFIPGIIIGAGTGLLYLIGNEVITVPFNRYLSDLRRYVIEKRTVPVEQRQIDVYRIEGNQVLWAREWQKTNEQATINNFLVLELDKERRVARRIDCQTASYGDSGWVGENVVKRQFSPDGGEEYQQFARIALNEFNISPDKWLMPLRPIEETSTLFLRRYITRMKKAGENVAREEVEYHYRFSYALIGLIVTLLGLPLAVKLRRGGVMLGLGLGLLFSFLYWGAIQTCRAFGYAHIISPFWAAWLPNIVFGVVAVILVLKAER